MVISSKGRQFFKNSHPFLFFVYFLLFLFQQNKSHLSIGMVLPHLLLGSVAVLLLLIVARCIFHDCARASLFTSLCVILFFSYGHAQTLIGDERSQNLLRLKPDLLLFPLWILLFYLGLLILYRSKSAFPILKQAVLSFAILLNIINGLSLLTDSARSHDSQKQTFPVHSPLYNVPKANVHSSRKPDIYYIVLDGYTRQDVLLKYFNLNTSSFISALKSKGFFVAEKSNANYCQTFLSLSASLNAQYIQQLLPTVPPTSHAISPVVQLLQHNAVMYVLKRLGYSTVAFETGYTETELRNVDCYLQPRHTMSEFSSMLINTTIMPTLLKAFQSNFSYTQHRRRIRYIFDNVAAKAIPCSSPKFVFAHILSPHQPFVFDSMGHPVNPQRPYSLWYNARGDEYKKGYRAQVKFTNKMILDLIDRLLAQSTIPPVIIVQGDHGSALHLHTESMEKTDLTERFAILNAVLLPEGGDVFYPQMTPINTIRLIFNELFGFAMSRSEDVSFYSTWPQPFNFKRVK